MSADIYWEAQWVIGELHDVNNLTEQEEMALDLLFKMSCLKRK